MAVDHAISPVRTDGWPNELVGNGLSVRVAGGEMIPYAYLDNAASTPALWAAAEAVERIQPWYSSVHRGAGYKSQVSTAAYEVARETVGAFVGAAPSRTVTFIKNTTEGLNRIAELTAERGATVLMSIMEHHANMLPWRFAARDVRYVQASLDGIIDEDELVRQLKAIGGPKLVAIAGAYNVSGYAPPVHRLATLAHAHGAEILVDGAQLVPHRRVQMEGACAGEEIDYLVFSSHKIYAPYGSGALIAPRSAYQDARPGLLGGGIVDFVTLDSVLWAPLPDREEAGSPNVVGAVALAAALRRMEEIGREDLERQEMALAAHLLQGLASIPGVRVLGPGAMSDRVGVVSFVVNRFPHSIVAAYLAHEHGIGVRNGCFCAHPGLVHLLGLTNDEVRDAEKSLRRGSHAGIPGAVRASLGLQNTRAEVDRLLGALRALVEEGPRAEYRLDLGSGDHVPAEPNVSQSAHAQALQILGLDVTGAGLHTS